MAETQGPRVDVEVEIFEGVRGPDGTTPVKPVRLEGRDTLNFSCHRGVSCWNACCHGADVTLTPYDIVRLCRHLDMRPREFLERYTVPAVWERADLPVAKLKMGGDDGRGPCAFVAEEGCTVYPDRPATCRYYPLGLATVKMKGHEAVEDFHFLVKEAHCRGHDEEHLQSVAQFRHEQGVEEYDRVNRGWMDILMKMASWKTLGGPFGKDISPQTRKMFYMVSTDVEALRRFVFETKFLDTYEIDPEVVDRLKTEDEALLALGFDWLKNVIFAEPTISMKQDVLRHAVAKARETMGGT